MAKRPAPVSTKRTRTKARHGSVQNEKQAQLAGYTEDPDGSVLTTNQGVRINDDQNSLNAGARCDSHGRC